MSEQNENKNGQSSTQKSPLSPVLKQKTKDGETRKPEGRLTHRVSFSEIHIPATPDSDEDGDPKEKPGTPKKKGSAGKEPDILPEEDISVPSHLKNKPEGFFLKNKIEPSISSPSES